MARFALRPDFQRNLEVGIEKLLLSVAVAARLPRDLGVAATQARRCVLETVTPPGGALSRIETTIRAHAPPA